MVRKSESRDAGMRAGMSRMKRTARGNLTAPNLIAAGVVALGAAAFAYLRDGERRARIKETALRLREEWPAKLDSVMRREPQPSGPQFVPTALP